MVEVVITGCCEGCEGVAVGKNRAMIDTEPKKHVFYCVPPEYQEEDDYDEDADAVQEHGIDPYDLPDLTDPEYNRAGRQEQSRAEDETSCIDENAFCLKC